MEVDYRRLSVEDAISQYTCPVCADLITDPWMVNTCGHTSCHQCLEQLDKCPICTVSYNNKTNLIPNSATLADMESTEIVCNCQAVYNYIDFP